MQPEDLTQLKSSELICCAQEGSGTIFLSAHSRMDEVAYDPVIKMDRGSIHFAVAYALETLISEWWNEIGRHGGSIASWTVGDIFENTWRSGSASERGK